MLESAPPSLSARTDHLKFGITLSNRGVVLGTRTPKDLLARANNEPTALCGARRITLRLSTQNRESE